jgi:uncharacterized protein
MPKLSSPLIVYNFMATVLITGGTGMIGQALSSELMAKGYSVIVLSRKPPVAHSKKNASLSYAQWDVQAQTIDRDAIQKADYIIHLAGANIAEGRWSEKRKQQIRDSRIKGSDLLVKALKEYPNHVQAVVSASAIGWYGPDPEVPNPHPFTEMAPAHTGFLGTTCQLWEDSIKPVLHEDRRLVILRTGIVLSNKGGAYKEFEKPLKLGVASVLGSGRQVVSWIHISDLVGIYIAALENKHWHGVYNAVAPAPVSNKDLILTIARQRGTFYVPAKVPELALKVALGEMSVEVLKSATVSNKKVEEAGYQFLFPTIETAVYNLTKKAS